MPEPRVGLGPAGDIKSEGVIGCGIHQAACGAPVTRGGGKAGMDLYGIGRGAARAETPVGQRSPDPRGSRNKTYSLVSAEKNKRLKVG